ELLVQQVLRQMEKNGRAAQVLKMGEGQVNSFADDALIADDGGSDQVRIQLKYRVPRELGSQAFLWQVDAIAFDAREVDFERVPIGAHGIDAYRLPRLSRWRDHGLGREVERNTQDVGVFDIEEIF